MSCSAPCRQVEILDQKGLEDLAIEWDALLLRSHDHRLFFTPVFARISWDHFPVQRAAILTLRGDDGSLEALLPLQIRRAAGRNILEIMGNLEVADYLDGLADRASAQSLFTQLWSCALTDLEWDDVEVRHVPATSSLLPALESAAGDMGIPVVIEEDEVCPVAILCNSWDGYLQMLSKKQRHEIRRKIRRATEGVDWSWRTVETATDLERDLPIFFQLHEASNRDKAVFMTQAMRDFFWDVARGYLQAGGLRLSTLRRDGVDVASNFSFVYRGRYLLYNSGYDPTFSDNNPGIAAVALSMQDAIAEKAIAFDFLSGNEPYKYQFGATNTYTHRATVARLRLHAVSSLLG